MKRWMKAILKFMLQFWISLLTGLAGVTLIHFANAPWLQTVLGTLMGALISADIARYFAKRSAADINRATLSLIQMDLFAIGTHLDGVELEQVQTDKLSGFRIKRDGESESALMSEGEAFLTRSTVGSGVASWDVPTPPGAEDTFETIKSYAIRYGNFPKQWFSACYALDAYGNQVLLATSVGTNDHFRIRPSELFRLEESGHARVTRCSYQTWVQIAF